MPPTDKITFQVDGEGGMLLYVAAGQMFGLNPAAAVAWPTLAACGNLDDAVAAVLRAFGIDEPTARADLAHLMANLCENGLLEQAR